MELETIKNYILNYCYDYLTKKEIMRYWFFTTLIIAIHLMFGYPYVYAINIFLMYFFLTGIFVSTVWSVVLFVNKKRRQSIKMHALYLGCTACMCGLVILVGILRSLVISGYSILLFVPILLLTASGGIIARIRINQNVAASLVHCKGDTENTTTNRKGISPGEIGALFGTFGFMITAMLVPRDMYEYLLFFIGVLCSVFFSFSSCVHLYRLYLIQKYCPQIDDYASKTQRNV